MWTEFKAFVNRGNVLDLAVGVIIGAAFGKIITSFTDDVLMPLIGLMTGGGVDFSSHFILLGIRVASPSRRWPRRRPPASGCSLMAAS